MVVNFEVGKTYRYNGKIGDPSPFVSHYIDIQDALFIVSGEPLVCTHAENGLCPSTEFEGMSWEGGWRLKGCYHLFDEVVDDTYAPVKKFETGKWYVCHLNERPGTWDDGGKMDGLLDGKPHKCIMGWKTFAEFEGIPLRGEAGWDFYCNMDYFEEVPSPVKSYSERQAEWVKETEMMKRYETETDEVATWTWHEREFLTDDYIAWLEAQLSWRPVSEKPEMGQRVLYFGGTVEIGKYNRYEEWIDTDGGICPVEFTSHWLPIPPAPEEEE